jgi:hypothetical protein
LPNAARLVDRHTERLATAEEAFGILYRDGMDGSLRYANLFQKGNRLASGVQQPIRVDLISLNVAEYPIVGEK